MAIITPGKEIITDSIKLDLIGSIEAKLKDLIDKTTDLEAKGELEKELPNTLESSKADIDALAMTIAKAIESYISKIVVEIEPGIEVEVDGVKGKTITKGSSNKNN